MPLVINGWTLLYHPVFGDRYAALRDRVKILKSTLTEAEYCKHPDVKLFASVYRALMEIVPGDPNRPDFLLKRDLAKFRRVKGHGLPPRYRLFYVFANEAKLIIFLYLNATDTLRKEGARTDPYEVFKDLVDSGRIGSNFEKALAQWHAAHKPQDGTFRG